MAEHRGRLDKRAAILDAATALFLHDGRVDAGGTEIAARARVAKPTLYAHFGRRETLIAVVADAALERITADDRAALEALTPAVDDLGEALVALAWALVRNHYRNPEAPGLRRLLQAHVAAHPDLGDQWSAEGPRQLLDALAGRLARVANAGRLDVPDPDRAAHQFVALVAFAAEHPPGGADPELDRTLRADVAMFLRAHRAGAA